MIIKADNLVLLFFKSSESVVVNESTSRGRESLAALKLFSFLLFVVNTFMGKVCSVVLSLVELICLFKKKKREKKTS